MPVPPAYCDPATILAEAQCLNSLPPNRLRQIEAYLTTYVANAYDDSRQWTNPEVDLEDALERGACYQQLSAQDMQVIKIAAMLHLYQTFNPSVDFEALIGLLKCWEGVDEERIRAIITASTCAIWRAPLPD